MTKFFLPMVKAVGVNAQQPWHPCNEIGPWRFEHQMEMIVHQTPGMHLPVGLLAGFPQSLQEELPVMAVSENRFTPIPAVNDVVDRTRVSHSEFSCPLIGAILSQ